jgi:hypothetical protein
VREAIEMVALVLAPVTLFGALLFYFGWARSSAQAHYFGLSGDVLGRSPREYALRSVDSIYWPCVLLVAGVLTAVLVHAGAKRLAAAQQTRLLFSLAVCGVVAGSALILFAALGVLWPRGGYGAVATPAAFAVGAPLTAYSLFVMFCTMPPRARRGLAAPPRAQSFLIAGLVAVFVFWANCSYADLRGENLAKRIAANLNVLPSVIVYSPRRLHLDGLGVEETRLTAPDSAYRYRYTGLHLLARAGARSFLVPSGWCRKDLDGCERHGVTFVLPDNDALRLDFAP